MVCKWIIHILRVSAIGEILKKGKEKAKRTVKKDKKTAKKNANKNTKIAPKVISWE